MLQTKNYLALPPILFRRKRDKRASPKDKGLLSNSGSGAGDVVGGDMSWAPVTSDSTKDALSVMIETIVDECLTQLGLRVLQVWTLPRVGMGKQNSRRQMSLHSRLVCALTHAHMCNLAPQSPFESVWRAMPG